MKFFVDFVLGQMKCRHHPSAARAILSNPAEVADFGCEKVKGRREREKKEKRKKRKKERKKRKKERKKERKRKKGRKKKKG